MSVVAEMELVGASAITTGAFLRPKNQVYVSQIGAGTVGTVLDLTKPHVAYRYAEYYARPWFVGAERVGNVFAVGNLEGTGLSICTIGRTRTT